MGSFSNPQKAATHSFATTVNQRGPGFTTRFGTDADGNRFQEFLETGAQKQLTDARGRLALGFGGVGDALSAGAEGSLAGAGASRDAAERATFDRALALLGPQQERQTRTARNNLVNTGNPIGSERARFELDQLNRNQAARLNDLALASVGAGQDAYSRSIADANNQIAGAGNLFSLMAADRPNYFAPDQLVSANNLYGPKQKKSKAGLLGAVGSIVGGGAGAFFGGPTGALAGAHIGGSLGNAAGY